MVSHAVEIDDLSIPCFPHWPALLCDSHSHSRKHHRVDFCNPPISTPTSIGRRKKLVVSHSWLQLFLRCRAEERRRLIGIRQAAKFWMVVEQSENEAHEA